MRPPTLQNRSHNLADNVIVCNAPAINLMGKAKNRTSGMLEEETDVCDVFVPDAARL